MLADSNQVMVSKGYRKRGCGVVLVKHVKNPILLAREMLVRGELDGRGGPNGGEGNPSGGNGSAQGHCILGGQTVEALARDWGLEMVPESYQWTKKRWDEHKRGLKDSGVPNPEWTQNPIWGPEEESWDGHEYLPQGTVGCVALDRFGTLYVQLRVSSSSFVCLSYPQLMFREQSRDLAPDTFLTTSWNLLYRDILIPKSP